MGDSSYQEQVLFIPSADNTLLKGMEETTLKVVGWQADVFKATNVSKVATFITCWVSLATSQISERT